MKSKLLRIAFILTLAIGFSTAAYQPAQAQCPMCRMSAESNLKDGGTAGKGLNTGILYMLVTPYLLVGFFGYMWYRNRRETPGEE
ncbi:MAG: hypothetical protein IPL49_05950 [Saprospirales bacterium]|nr:hypothetical protein [Saprospirales bacterium]MBK8490448.1 hypothetical protein [Saprospirales bacterium]